MLDTIESRRGSRTTLDAAADGLQSFTQSRMCLGIGLFLAFAGAGFATGIMAYEAVAREANFTTESWVLIPPLWLGVAATWAVTTRWPLVGTIPFGVLTLYTATYFSDVYGHYVAGGLLLLGSAVVLSAALKTGDRATV